MSQTDSLRTIISYMKSSFPKMPYPLFEEDTKPCHLTDVLMLSETQGMVSRFLIYHIAAGKKNEVKFKIQPD